MTRCLCCGELPSTLGEAELVEVHELCRRCREDDLTERIAFIRREIRELGEDLDKATRHVIIAHDIETTVAGMTASLNTAA